MRKTKLNNRKKKIKKIEFGITNELIEILTHTSFKSSKLVAAFSTEF